MRPNRRLRVLLVGLLLAVLVGPVSAVPAQAAPVDDAAPATIRVCRSSGGVDHVTFKDYVKTVLPVEYFASWPDEALRAGAVAIKSYAWHYVLNPISDRCDLGDTTRYQVYDPSKQRRSARTDQAVEDTWHLRLDDTSRDAIAFAQYCSRGCTTHARYAGEGRYMDQDRMLEQAEAGWHHVDILQYWYRNLPSRLWSWTSPFGLTTNEDVVDLDAPPSSLLVGVAGVGAGDGRVRGDALAACTIDGTRTAVVLQSVGVIADPDGAPALGFDDLSGLSACQDEEASLVVRLVVNGHVAVQRAIPAWRRWHSSVDRQVARVAETADPVAGSIQVARATFDAVDPEGQAQGEAQLLMDLMGEGGEDGVRLAERVVIARADAFPDALGATALAGTTAPILLHPSGADRSLEPSIRDEVTRLLEPGSMVQLVGGPGAIGQQVEEDLVDLGYVVERIAGADRVATAQAIADVVVGDGTAPRVLLVRGFPDTTAGWADAVAVGPWAARTGTPILVTPDAFLAPSVEAWIEDPARGVEEVLVVGGTAAVPGTVETSLDGVTVTRFRGERRDATALELADDLWGTRGSPEARHVVVADVYGRGGWAFAVAGAVPAAIGDAATIAVADLVPPTTVGHWFDARPSVGATIVGGPGVVTQKVEESLAGPASSED